jgi:hypothetical protein
MQIVTKMQSHTEQLIKSTPIRAQWFFRLPSLVSVESFFRAFSSPLFPLIYSKCLKLSFISKIQKIFNETPFFSSKIRWQGKFSGNFFEGNKNIQIEGKAPVSVPMRKLLLNSNSFGFGLQDETIFNWLFNKILNFPMNFYIFPNIGLPLCTQKEFFPAILITIFHYHSKLRFVMYINDFIAESSLILSIPTHSNHFFFRRVFMLFLGPNIQICKCKTLMKKNSF